MNAPEQRETLTVLRSHTQPLATPVLAKVGCTFLRSLFYLLDNGKQHPDPLHIHQEPSLRYESLAAEDFAELVGFYVMRDPQDRFFSLYWDKVWGGSANPFPWLIDRLEPLGFDRNADLTIEQHRVNCNRLLGFLERRFRRKGSPRVNMHWMPQVHRSIAAERLGLQAVLLDQISEQLPIVAAGRVPGLDEAIAELGRTNQSARPFANAEVVDQRIGERLGELYREDFTLVARARADWAAT